VRDKLYSKRLSKKVDSKCNPTRKAEHKRGELVDRMKDLGRRKG